MEQQRLQPWKCIYCSVLPSPRYSILMQTQPQSSETSAIENGIFFFPLQIALKTPAVIWTLRLPLCPLSISLMRPKRCWITCPRCPSAAGPRPSSCGRFRSRGTEPCGDARSAFGREPAAGRNPPARLLLRYPALLPSPRRAAMGGTNTPSPGPHLLQRRLQ